MTEKRDSNFRLPLPPPTPTHTHKIKPPRCPHRRLRSPQVSTVSRKEVPYSGPYLRPPFTFQKTAALKRLLLSKLVNAEFASLDAPGFSQYTLAGFRDALAALAAALRPLALHFNDCHTAAKASPKSKRSLKVKDMLAQEFSANGKTRLERKPSSASNTASEESKDSLFVQRQTSDSTSGKIFARKQDANKRLSFSPFSQVKLFVLCLGDIF